MGKYLDVFMNWLFGYQMSDGVILAVGTIANVLVVALPVLLAVAMIVWVDRKVWAAIQLRKGPNVVGPFGLMQSFADGLKVFLKETIIPAGANKFLFLLAPGLSLIFGLVGWAVIPFGEGDGHFRPECWDIISFCSF